MRENTLWFDDVKVEPASLNEMLLSRVIFAVQSTQRDFSSERFRGCLYPVCSGQDGGEI